MNIDFKTFQSLCLDVLKNIKDREYDGIVCPLRGGFYLSDFISRKLNLPIYYLDINSYTEKQKRKFNFKELSKIPNKGYFLICDDIYDTGDTVNYIKNKFNYLSFDVAVLSTKKEIDNLVYGFLSDDWVVFPWE